jgi:tRNA wybutosine-synthesizing protein 1
MSPAVMFCQNQCIHCWRAIELTLGDKLKKINEPKEIIESCIEGQRILLSGYKGYDKVNKRKLKEAFDPIQFAISLSGEPTLYPKLAELIKELKKQKKTTFLVTNGLLPERLLELKKKKALPTQLYISLNAPNQKLYEEWHNSKAKGAWKKFNESLEVMRKLGTRKVIRLTLVKNLNMKSDYLKGYAKLILKAEPDFVEVKGYMAIGFARKRLGYERMPSHAEIKEFSKLLLKFLPDYKYLDEQEVSRVVLLGKDKREMKIRVGEI